MDATANDLPLDVGFTIEGFPTLKLCKAKSNEFIEYDGDRSLNSLIEFIKKNGGNDYSAESIDHEDL